MLKSLFSSFPGDGMCAPAPLRETERGRTERRLIDALAEYGVLPPDRSPLLRLVPAPRSHSTVDLGPVFASGD
jgi:hypothetical protein